MRTRSLAPCLAALAVAAMPCLAALVAVSTPCNAQTDPIGAAIIDHDRAALDAPAARAAPAAPRPTPPSFDARGISSLLQHDPGGTPAAPRAIDAPPASDHALADLKSARAPLTPDAVNAARFSRLDAASRTVDPVVLKAEILLDRAHAPPGVIDGRYGSNFVKAIKTFEMMRELPVDGKLARRVWDELGADTADPVLGSYTITAQDVVGPFYPDLSPDYAEQAKMPDLGYRSAAEMFGERFHMDRKFLEGAEPGHRHGGRRQHDRRRAGRDHATRLALSPASTSTRRKGQVLAFDDAAGSLDRRLSRHDRQRRASFAVGLVRRARASLRIRPTPMTRSQELPAGQQRQEADPAARPQ